MKLIPFRRVRRCACAALLAGAFISCGRSSPAPPDRATAAGTPTGAAVSATIGAEGGDLAAPGGSLRVRIPAGAFAGRTQVTIQPITNKAHGGVGTAYRIQAQGVSDPIRASLVFTYSDDDVKGSAPGELRLAFQREDGQWQVAGGAILDKQARTVTVETDHFSDWSKLRGRILQPSEATVRVGENAYFQVVSCIEPQVEGDLAPLVVPCTPSGTVDDPEWEDPNWEVNGVAGGNAAVGTATRADEGSGRYTAPAEVPDPDTVTVSARFKSSEDLPGGAEILLAPVRIVEDPGPGRVIFKVNATCEADYKFSDGTSSVTDRVVVTLIERSVYRIVQYDNGEDGTDLELVSYSSRIIPKGGGRLQTPSPIPDDLLASSWSYRNREPTHPSGGLRLDLPGGRAQVGLWANFAELLQATPEQSWAGAGGIAVQTINDAEREGSAYRQAMRSSFEAKAKKVSVTGQASHSYTGLGGLGSGRLTVNYAITSAAKN